MNMKTIFKSLLFLLAVTTGMTLSSCSSDNNLPAADALFRPVLTENNNIEHGLDENLSPYMIVTWDNFTDATQYVISAVANDGSDSQIITTDTTVCQFNNLQYDKEYNVSIRCENTTTGLASKDFTLTTTTLDYPTKLASISTSDVIDTQVRIKWSDVAYDRLDIFKDSSDELVTSIELTDEDNKAGNIIIRNLDPSTSYRVLAYSEDVYLGKKRFSTTSEEDFGDDVVIDLRSLTEEESAKYITTDLITADIEANPDKNITYVLQGGVKYTIASLTIPGYAKRLKFVTGLTLAGNAEFINSKAITVANGVEIEAIEFEKIHFYAGNGEEDVKTNTKPAFSSKQVFNINGTGTTVKSLSFKSCRVDNYRAVVRGQTKNDHIQNTVFDDCIINGIGNQGVITIADKGGDFQSVKATNCTFTNIVMLADLRKTKEAVTLDFENCTFCYAPMETTADTKTPLFRFGSNTVTLNIKKTLFGPSMFTKDGKGSAITTFKAGENGSILLDASKTTVNVENSYKTDFTYTPFGETATIYPIEGLTESKLSETGLWKAPAEGIFNVIGKLDETGIGDARWF